MHNNLSTYEVQLFTDEHTSYLSQTVEFEAYLAQIEVPCIKLKYLYYTHDRLKVFKISGPGYCTVYEIVMTSVDATLIKLKFPYIFSLKQLELV